MRTKIGLLSALITICLIVMPSCNPPWEDHYSIPEGQIDMELWEAVSMEPNFSTYVSKMQELGLDTIFQDGLVYTLFIPNNEAFNSYKDTGNLMQIMQYHITKTIIIDGIVQKSRRLFTITEKYALIEHNGSDYTFDGIPIIAGSPLFQNGKYYEISNVALPKPNLYEFTAEKSLGLKEYIDSKDSIYLDRGLSTPIGFDEKGNTIYDSVFNIINTFEQEYFPISEEFRNKAATFIIFTNEQYISALDDMAAKLGGDIVDHNDIPASWQDNILLPDFTERAMFPGDLSYSDLEQGKLLSITGDSVEIQAEYIDPESRSICSNGTAYLYSDFIIPDELYIRTAMQEGELLLDSVGAGKFAWKEGVTTSGIIIEPEKSYSTRASEGSLANVSFVRNFSGEFSLEFTFREMFPMRYRLEWRGNYRPSGMYEVYVNDQILEYKDKFDESYTAFDTYYFNSPILSVTGELFQPDEVGFNTRDYWIDHLTDYGDIRIRFKYLGPGEKSTNGFNIDYVKLIPES